MTDAPDAHSGRPDAHSGHAHSGRPGTQSDGTPRLDERLQPILTPDRPSSLVPHRPWSTILLVILSIGFTAGLLAIALGAAVLASASDAPPDPTGIGMDLSTVFTTLLVIGGLVMAVPSGIMLALTVSGRRRADEDRPRLLHSVGVMTLGASGLWAVLFLVYAFPLGLVACAVYALPAYFVLRATAETPPTGAATA